MIPAAFIRRFDGMQQVETHQHPEFEHGFIVEYRPVGRRSRRFVAVVPIGGVIHVSEISESCRLVRQVRAAKFVTPLPPKDDDAA